MRRRCRGLSDCARPYTRVGFLEGSIEFIARLLRISPVEGTGVSTVTTITFTEHPKAIAPGSYKIDRDIGILTDCETFGDTRVRYLESIYTVAGAYVWLCFGRAILQVDDKGADRTWRALGICTWDSGCKGIKGQDRATTVIVWTGAQQMRSHCTRGSVVSEATRVEDAQGECQPPSGVLSSV